MDKMSIVLEPKYFSMATKGLALKNSKNIATVDLTVP
jgi:hypothetical protein